MHEFKKTRYINEICIIFLRKVTFNIIVHVSTSALSNMYHSMWVYVYYTQHQDFGNTPLLNYSN